MIIECINCSKKFQVNSELIPQEGRSIQCGSCGHVWFFLNNNQENQEILKSDIKINMPSSIQNNANNEKILKENKSIESFTETKKQKLTKKKVYDLTKYKKVNKFSFSKFLSYIIVFIITFIALLIIIDTFKNYFYEKFPNLEIVLFNLFETLTDIKLFIKDLI